MMGGGGQICLAPISEVDGGRGCFHARFNHLKTQSITLLAAAFQLEFAHYRVRRLWWSCPALPHGNHLGYFEFSRPWYSCSWEWRGRRGVLLQGAQERKAWASDARGCKWGTAGESRSTAGLGCCWCTYANVVCRVIWGRCVECLFRMLKFLRVEC